MQSSLLSVNGNLSIWWALRQIGHGDAVREKHFERRVAGLGVGKSTKGLSALDVG